MIENLYFQLAVKEIYVYYRKVCIHIDMVTFDSKLIVKICSNNAETSLLKTHCIPMVTRSSRIVILNLTFCGQRPPQFIVDSSHNI